MFWTRNHPTKFMPKRVVDALATHFEPDEIDQLAQLGTMIDVSAGSNLMVEGAIGREAFVLVTGTASVVRDGATIATIRPGEIVGEIALLSGTTRTATVVADTDITVYALSPSEFASLLARCPQLERRVAAAAVRRLTAV